MRFQLHLFRLLYTFRVFLPGCNSSWMGGPRFVESPVNVTVSEGNQAFLPCRVTNLGDKSVTWMRRNNLHIITAGMLTYSPDDRFRVLHPTNSDEWTLHIKFAQPSDGGWFECQVNSDPKITRPVFLAVKDKNLSDPFYKYESETEDNSTEVRVEGPDERYMQHGSVLSLTCSIFHSDVRGPDRVLWYHGARWLQYDSPRGGIALQTEKTSTRTISRLMLSNVTPQDSGRYSCRPDTGGSDSVSVHIQSSQHHAAVQQSGHSSASGYWASPLMFGAGSLLLVLGHPASILHFR